MTKSPEPEERYGRVLKSAYPHGLMQTTLDNTPMQILVLVWQSPMLTHTRPRILSPPCIAFWACGWRWDMVDLESISFWAVFFFIKLSLV